MRSAEKFSLVVPLFVTHATIQIRPITEAHAAGVTHIPSAMFAERNCDLTRLAGTVLAARHPHYEMVLYR